MTLTHKFVEINNLVDCAKINLGKVYSIIKSIIQHSEHNLNRGDQAALCMRRCTHKPKVPYFFISPEMNVFAHF